MAEEKKVAIKFQRLGDKPLKEYVEAVADPAGKPENGSAAALVAALAASLGSLAAASAEEGKIDAVVLQELPEMSKYMLKQVEEMVKSRAPLMKRLAEGGSPEELESAARVACGIPNEIVYLMCRCMELLEQLKPLVRAEDAHTIRASAYLCLAAINIMRGEIDVYATYMQDASFQYVVKREAELNVQEHEETIANLLEA